MHLAPTRLDRIPSWINRPYGVIDVTATLTFPGGGVIGDFEARVTVYWDENGEWQIGEMEVQQLRDDATSYVVVEQDAGTERTLSGFLADAILAETKRDWFDKAVADLRDRMAADARDAA